MEEEIFDVIELTTIRVQERYTNNLIVNALIEYSKHNDIEPCTEVHIHGEFAGFVSEMYVDDFACTSDEIYIQKHDNILINCNNKYLLFTIA